MKTKTLWEESSCTRHGHMEDTMSGQVSGIQIQTYQRKQRHWRGGRLDTLSCIYLGPGEYINFLIFK